MSEPHPEVMEFLLSRRSRPAKTLSGPVPDREQLGRLLMAAARTPDHGKLEPWRFVVLETAALLRLADAVDSRAIALEMATEKVRKATDQFAKAECVVAVVASPKPSEKVPQIEQLMSAGAVCLSLLNAALASGWGANWLTGFAATDPTILQDFFGLDGDEFIAGFIHIGTETSAPPERPRPDVAALTEWMRS